MKEASHRAQALDIPHIKNATSVVSFVKQVLDQALSLKASDIHLECYENGARLRYRLDGVLKAVASNTFFLSNFSAIITRIKVLAALDISDSRSAQDGSFNFSGQYGKADIRVSILPAVTGERAVLRILPASGKAFTFTQLGMSDEQIDLLDSALMASQGAILVSGPTGSGKTTSLYTMIQQLDHESINILTIENPVERRLYGIGQVQVNESNHFDFSHALRTFLRQDPEVILLGEIRDNETAEVAMKAAMTGHLVLSTLHANSNIGTVMRLIGLGLNIDIIRNAIKLIVSQRLLRLVCPHCKSICKHNKQTFIELGRKYDLDVSELAVGRGCKQCSYTGYLGRLGVFEMLGISPQTPIQKAIHGDLDCLRQWTLGASIAKACTTLLAQQKISLLEYQRVLLASNACDVSIVGTPLKM